MATEIMVVHQQIGSAFLKVPATAVLLGCRDPFTRQALIGGSCSGCSPPAACAAAVFPVSIFAAQIQCRDLVDVDINTEVAKGALQNEIKTRLVVT